MPPGCRIKGKLAMRARVTGNVGVYHLQGCRSYPALTKPDRWFCSEEDAQAAGFRKAYNCGSAQEAAVTNLSYSKTKQRAPAVRPKIRTPHGRSSCAVPSSCLSAGLALLSAATAFAQNDAPHNLILFVPDGLRARRSRPRRRRPWPKCATRASISGTRTRCSRPSPRPTPRAMATGHYLGDTGASATRSMTGYTSRRPPADTVTPFLGIRSGAARYRRAFRRQLSERGSHAQARARQGILHRRDRQGRPRPGLRP